MPLKASNISGPTAVPLSALVLATGDYAIIVRKVLESHGFVVTSAVDVGVAQELCKRGRFDLGVYDQDVNGVLDLAGSAFSSKPRIAVGLLRAGEPIQVPGMRLHFVVHKPFTGDLFAKTVKAAYGPIFADRRESRRCKVNVKVADCNVLYRGELRALADVSLLNLSRTGLCLEAAEMLPQAAIVEVSFTLPQSEVQVQLVGNVVWAHASGRGGIKFSQLDSAEQRKLEDWFESVLPILEELPA